MERKWNLWLGTGVQDCNERRDLSIYITATDQQIKQKLLDYLKTVLRRRRTHKYVYAMLFPDTPRMGERVPRADDIVRLKYRYSNRRLLSIRNPEVALVQGYGPEILDEIEK